jgi:uncharacterized UPF0160 family protein
VFHCDEVLATCLLRYTEKYANARILRTRNDDLLKLCDIVCDVGSTFDPAQNLFDHHQRTFDQFWNEEEKTVKLSSAGLVWKYFGKEILVNTSRKLGVEFENEQRVNFVWELIYKKFFYEVDAIDNGVNESQGGKRIYSVGTGLSSRIARLNSDDQCAQFKKA